MESSLGNLPGTRGTSRFDVHVIYEKKVDAAAECERLKKELEKIEKEIANGQRQLSNDQFLAKAPAKVVEGIKTRADELKVLREKAVAQMKELAWLVVLGFPYARLDGGGCPLTNYLWTGIHDASPRSSRTR